MIAGVLSPSLPLVPSSCPSPQAPVLQWFQLSYRKYRRVLFSLDLAMSSWAMLRDSWAMLSTAQQYNCYLGLSYFSSYILEMYDSSHEDLAREKLDWNNLLCDSVINGVWNWSRHYCFHPYFTHISQHSSQFFVVCHVDGHKAAWPITFPSHPCSPVGLR